MEKAYIQALIIRIGGARATGESKKAYLARVAEYVDVPYRSLCEAYYGGYISKNTREKLEKAAKHARKPYYLVAVVEHQLRLWEADPKEYRPHIHAAREFLLQLRRADRIFVVPQGNDDDAVAATTA